MVSITLTLQKTGDERRPASALASASAYGGRTSRSRRRVNEDNVRLAFAHPCR